MLQCRKQWLRPRFTVAAALIRLTAATGDAAPPDDSVPPIGLVPPACMLDADNCSSFQELQAWREGQFQAVWESVPQPFQGYARHHIENEFRVQLGRLGFDNSSSNSVGIMPGGAAGHVPANDHVQSQDCATRLASAILDTSGRSAKTTLPILFMTASMCSTRGILDVWSQCQMKETVDHVPDTYRGFAFDHVRLAVEKRMSELTGDASNIHESSASENGVGMPVVLLVGEHLDTEDELRAWRAYQLSQVNVRVPETYHLFVSSLIEGTFQHRLATLQRLRRNPQVSTARFQKFPSEHVQLHQAPSALRFVDAQEVDAVTLPGIVAGAYATSSVSREPEPVASNDMGHAAPVSASSMVLLGFSLVALVGFVASIMEHTRRSGFQSIDRTQAWASMAQCELLEIVAECSS